MIVVEGVDNAGKSTLIRALQVVLPAWPVQASEGPPKYKGEQNDRVMRYFTAHGADFIYDRHPCVSQPIYSAIRSHTDPIDPLLIEKFYNCEPLFIYCDGGDRGMKGHIFNPATDTEKHLDEVRENYGKLLLHYRMWAGKHAFMTYRIGDSISRITKTVEHLLSIGRV